MTIHAYAADALDYDSGISAGDNTTYGLMIDAPYDFAEKTFTAVTSNCWVHWRNNFTESTTAGGSLNPDFIIYDDAGTPTSVFEIFSSEPEADPVFRVRNSSGTLLQEWDWADVTSATDTAVNTFDVSFDFSAGSLTCYVNGSEAFSYTGHGRTGISKMRVANTDLASAINYHGEFLVASWNTIGARVKSVTLGTATTNDLTGTEADLTGRTNNKLQSAYLANTLTGDTNGDSFIAPTSGYTKDADTTIAAVVHNVYALKQTGSAVGTLKSQYVIGGTEYDVKSTTLTGSQTQYSQVQETSPATSSTWTESEVQGMSVGLELAT
jgi:hypothetical protein